MSERKYAIREYVVAQNAASMQVLEALREGDFARPVYSAEAAAPWTVRDVLAHLADSERGQLGQVQRLAAGGQTVPPDFDLDRWNRRIVEKRARHLPADLLADIRAAFEGLLALLDNLDEADLDKAGHHPRGDELSVEGYFRRIASHRAEHAAEVQAALGR
jgi:DinB superfamily